MNFEYSVISNYLIGFVENNWNKVILRIKVQPGVLGLSGDLILENDKRISLRTRPTEPLEEAIENLLHKTALNEETKWNFLEFEIFKNGSFSIKYIWDQEYQDKLDSYGKQEKEQATIWQK